MTSEYAYSLASDHAADEREFQEKESLPHEVCERMGRRRTRSGNAGICSHASR